MEILIPCSSFTTARAIVEVKLLHGELLLCFKKIVINNETGICL